MKTTERLKMCPFCEGEIALDATNCKYCGSEITLKKKSERPASNLREVASLEDSLASYYQPPYVAKTTEESVSVTEKTSHNTDPVIEKKEDNTNITIFPMLLLSIGGQLFTLSLLLLLFSEHGKLILEWKSRYWIVYLLSSVPMIYYGWCRLKP